MPILEVEPTGWASWDALVTADGAPIAELRISAWKSRGRFQLDGEDFTIEPSGFWLQNAVLKRGESVVARAERPALLRRQFSISSGSHRMALESRSWAGREYALQIGTQEAGRITREGFLGRKVTLRMAEDLPEALQIFLAYLVICQTKREAAAAAAGS